MEPATATDTSEPATQITYWAYIKPRGSSQWLSWACFGDDEAVAQEKLAETTDQYYRFIDAKFRLVRRTEHVTCETVEERDMH